tara:strand:- start:50 stop:481 length:432 start_codon:yes stop_codon:yes gene_type:complete
MLDKKKRNFLCFTCTLLFIISPKVLYTKSELDFLLAGPLAGNIYYTKKSPGRWKGLIEPHIPFIVRNSNFIEVTTQHEMKGFEHYIIKHIVLDKNFNFISEKKFDPSKDRAFSRHDISGFKGSVYILSICNHHDIWLEHFLLQ